MTNQPNQVSSRILEHEKNKIQLSSSIKLEARTTVHRDERKVHWKGKPETDSEKTQHCEVRNQGLVQTDDEEVENTCKLQCDGCVKASKQIRK